jgi:hypothetical protein
MAWQTFRMYYTNFPETQVVNSNTASNPLRPTQHCFRGRTYEEARKRMLKFCRDAGLTNIAVELREC